MSVVVQCGDAFDDRLRWLLSLRRRDDSEPLLRVEEIGPADSPRYARVAGDGVSLWLDRDRQRPAQPLTLRFVAPVTSGDDAPPGCALLLVDADPCDGHPRESALPLLMPALSPRLSVSRRADGAWGVGRV